MKANRTYIALAAAAVVWTAAAVGLMALMAVAMSGHWGMMDHGGMMGRGSSGEDQPPLVSTADEVTVDIRDFTFVPGNLTVNASAKVTWVNYDSIPHTATSRSDVWDSGKLDQDDSAAFVFDTPGTYPYYCVYHPDMTATVTVN